MSEIHAELLFCVPCSSYLSDPTTGQVLEGVTSLHSTIHARSSFNWGFEFEVFNPLELDHMWAQIAVECEDEIVGTAIHKMPRVKHYKGRHFHSVEIWAVFGPVDAETVREGLYRVRCYLATSNVGPFTRCHGVGGMYVVLE